MNQEDFEEYERILNQLGIKSGDNNLVREIARICYNVIGNGDTCVEGIRDDLEHVPGIPMDPKLFGLVCGIMYERKYIAKQMKKQGVVLVGLDH